MTSNISNYFLRADMLKRQGRTARVRRNADSAQSSLFPSTSLRSQALNIIIEEDESRACSRSPSPLPNLAESNATETVSLKAKRRHANVSDIRIARDMPVHDENDLSPFHDNLLSSPRPAPSPPQSSPDSFKLSFPGASLKFPHPPSSPTSILGYYHECESPTSSLSSSPGTLPLTPCSSDDESTRFVNPRRVSIRPLVITKHSQRLYDELSISPSAIPIEAKDAPETSSDSEPESDSEWYTREFSKILTLRSPLPPSFPQQDSSRPDSVFISTDDFPHPSTTLKRRVSKSISPTKRASMIPKYPPPPVPSAGSARSTPSPSPSSVCSRNPSHRRPPPRSSIPADLVFDFDEELDGDDSSSVFSFSMYEIDLGDKDFERPQTQSSRSQSSGSAYSQPSFDFADDEFSDHDVTFDMDYSMMLPLSLPATPIDLEADIALGLEQLRNSDNEQPASEEKELVFEDQAIVESPMEQAPGVQQPPTQQLPAVVDDVFSPMSACFSPPPSASFLPYYTDDSYLAPSPPPAQHRIYNEERVLKSKWSSSTLSSVREEHERRGASSKLRLYFGGQSSSSKRSSQTPSRNSRGASKVPATPTSPFGSFMSPRKASKTTNLPAAAPSPSPSSAKTRAPQVHARGNSGSDIGYGNNGVGVRRRGSVSTISDAGTEVSSSSTSSSGLRRKPIPVEMFLRSAA